MAKWLAGSTVNGDYLTTLQVLPGPRRDPEFVRHAADPGGRAPPPRPHHRHPRQPLPRRQGPHLLLCQGQAHHLRGHRLLPAQPPDHAAAAEPAHPAGGPRWAGRHGSHPGDVGAVFACVGSLQAMAGFLTPLYNQIYTAVCPPTPFILTPQTHTLDAELTGSQNSQILLEALPYPN